MLQTPGRFATIEQARSWMGDFIDWYNRLHRYSGLSYISPDQRQRGEDLILFAKWNDTLQKTYERHSDNLINKFLLNKKC